MVALGDEASPIRDFGSVAELPRQDPAANVEVDVHHSDLNYKDAMIVLGRKGVVKGWPIVPGIDFAGTVRSSQSPLFKPGDPVNSPLSYVPLVPLIPTLLSPTHPPPRSS